MSKQSNSGTMNATINDTVVAGSTTSYRVVARVATNAPLSGATLSFLGKVEILTP